MTIKVQHEGARLRSRARIRHLMADVIGWDIGGVNTKAARVAAGEVLAVRTRPYEIQRAPHALAPLLRELAAEICDAPQAEDPQGVAHAVTMTAELSQMFRTKRDGVAFVLDAVEAAFPASFVHVWAVNGRFLSTAEARREPLAVAAANWSATAHAIAHHLPDVLLIDTGTTTTDVIPIVGGAVSPCGLTDPERLASGELLYTGAVRTPTEAIAGHVSFGGTLTGVSAEGFALSGDVHVWRGDLAQADYTCPTPDGRPASREFAGERLARVICSDRDQVDEAAVSSIADALAKAQVDRIADGIRRVLARHRGLRQAVVTGLGAFIAEAAAREVGLHIIPLAAQLGEAEARSAPAVSVALLLEAARSGTRPDARCFQHAPQYLTAAKMRESACVEIVVKLGGGVLAHARNFSATLAEIAAAGKECRLLVVPGGGPFAEAVREVERHVGVGDDAAHWMAVLAMDQYAHLVAAQLPDGVLVSDPHEIAAALDAGKVPILAVSRWLREADPLPHTWDVTSDSIAAWVAGVLGARHLVLVKPSGARAPVEGVETGGGQLSSDVFGNGLVDPYFVRALPPSVAPRIVAADQLDALRAALRASR
jgi:(4-(4-[2-(gamma-L-glutamylamino)ethyl]phenoxymethyl)furan-2-yl)methanamine synthase